MIFWSIACASHALASGFWMLAASRFLLGAGEGGGFPAATKTVAEWFPVRERSTAMGLINAGTAVGAVVAPPAIAAIITYGHWRWVFVACGAVGLLWTIWWVRAYFSPAQHPRLSSAERAGSRGCRSPRRPQPRAPRPPGRHCCGIREVWGLVGAKFLTDAAWFFYIAWLPKYLYDARGFDVKQVGYYAWVPFAAAGVGSLLGGLVLEPADRVRALRRFLAQAGAGSVGGRDAGHHLRHAACRSNGRSSSSASRSSASSPGPRS